MSEFDPHAYVDAVAPALDLPVPPQYRAAVEANLARLHSLAREVLDFEPPLEPAPG